MEEFLEEIEVDEQDHSEGYEEPQMILGNRERIRHEGTIRGGKKVLRKLKDDATAKEKEAYAKMEVRYKELEAEGMSYDDIDIALGGTPNTSNTKLRLTNTGHFIIRDDDFNRPVAAQFLRETYAEKLGPFKGEVVRIPIWFPVNDFEKAIPHGFLSFGKGKNLKAYSFYKGDALTCKYLGVAPGADPSTKPVWLERPCEKQDCAVYKSKQCSFKGAIIGNIPGIIGLGGVKIKSAWYGMADAMAVLKGVRELRRGRIDGTHRGKPFLEVVKTQMMVKDPTDGKKKRQFVVTLELSVDPLELKRENDPSEVARRGSLALAALSGKPMVVAEEPDVTVPEETAPVLVEASEPAAESTSVLPVSEEVKESVAEAAGVAEEKVSQPVRDLLSAEPKLPPIPSKEEAPSVDKPIPLSNTDKPADVKVIGEGMIKTVQSRQKRVGMPDEVFAKKLLKEFNVSRLEELPAAKINDLLTLIGKWTPENGGNGVSEGAAISEKEASNAGGKSVPAGAGVGAGPEIF